MQLFLQENIAKVITGILEGNGKAIKGIIENTVTTKVTAVEIDSKAFTKADDWKTDLTGNKWSVTADGSGKLTVTTQTETLSKITITSDNATVDNGTLTGTGVAATDKIANSITYTTSDGHTKATILADSYVTVSGFTKGNATTAATLMIPSLIPLLHLIQQ